MARFALFAAAALAACAPLPGGDDGDDGTWTSEVNGSISGAATGTVTKGTVWLAGYPTSTDGVRAIFQIGATTGSDGQLALTAPAGLADATVASTIGLMQLPAPGTFTQTSSQSCGGVALTATGTAGTGSWVATGAHDCQGGDDDVHGSYTLTLSSVKAWGTVAAGAIANYYTVHGSLTASMPGTFTTGSTPVEGTVTLSLTF